MDTIIGVINDLSLYICGAWALVFIVLNRKQAKDNASCMSYIKDTLAQNYDIDLDKDILSHRQ